MRYISKLYRGVKINRYYYMSVSVNELFNTAEFQLEYKRGGNKETLVLKEFPTLEDALHHFEMSYLYLTGREYATEAPYQWPSLICC